MSQIDCARGDLLQKRIPIVPGPSGGSVDAARVSVVLAGPNARVCSGSAQFRVLPGRAGASDVSVRSTRTTVDDLSAPSQRRELGAQRRDLVLEGCNSLDQLCV